MSEPLSCWASRWGRARISLTLVGGFVAGLTLVALINTLVIFAYLAGAASTCTLSVGVALLARATIINALAISTSLTGSTLINALAIFALLARTAIINALAISTSLTGSTLINANAIFALLARTAIINALAIRTSLTGSTLINAHAIFALLAWTACNALAVLTVLALPAFGLTSSVYAGLTFAALIIRGATNAVSLLV